MNATETKLAKHDNDHHVAFLRPRVDVYENDAEFLLVADLPGVAQDGVDVRFDDGQLTIEARRREVERPGAVALEFQRAHYKCAFAVPEGIEADKIDAQLAGGVLTLHVPKAAAKRARRIEVRSA